MPNAERTSREVLVALYVRDALGIVDPSGLPRLLGTGLPEVDPPDPGVTWAWMRWWVSIVEPGSTFPAPPDELQSAWHELMRHHLDSARTYAAVAHDAAPAFEPVDTDLRIEVLPLAEWGVWWIGENTVAVDEGLRGDAAAFSAALMRMRD
jgi:hypothetical protein